MINAKEILNRVYDTIFDNVGMSKYHKSLLDLEEDHTIEDQWIDGETNKISLMVDGRTFIIYCEEATQ